MSITPVAGLAGSLDSTTNRTSCTLPLATLLLLGLFIFTIGIRVNYTNIDEAYFADPVINLLTGHGYTTTAWNITGASETHVSTAPAYSFLLLVWLKLFGISQTAVRSLAAVVVMVGAWVFWRACLRAGFIKSGIAGALVLAVLVLDYGYAYSYSVGRPDALSALCVAALFYFSTLRNQPMALGAMGAIAVLLPLVQWSCVIYIFFLSVALLALLKGKILRHVVVVGLGLGLGLLIQRLAYGHFGIWDTWMNTVNAERSESIIKWADQRITFGSLINRHSNTIPKDFSALVIMAGMAFIYFRGKFFQKGEAGLAKSAWMIATVVTLGMYFVGKFPTYYGWMLSLPLAAIIGAHFDRVRTEGKWESGLTGLMAALACAVGLPLQASLAIHDWQERQPAAIAASLAPQITKTDVVFCDYPFYYIVKERAGVVFTGHYFNKMSLEALNGLTLAVIGSHGSDWNQAKYPLTNQPAISHWQPVRTGILGNDWQYGILSAPNYSCTVYKFNKEAQ